MRKFYYEYDEVEGTWDVYEEDGGKESGGSYDVLVFCCASEQDAIDAVEILLELQEQ